MRDTWEITVFFNTTNSKFSVKAKVDSVQRQDEVFLAVFVVTEKKTKGFTGMFIMVNSSS